MTEMRNTRTSKQIRILALVLALSTGLSAISTIAYADTIDESSFETGQATIQEGVEQTPLPIEEVDTQPAEEGTAWGDLNGDGNLTLADLALAVASLGKKADDEDWPAHNLADFNKDGIIDIQDILIWSENLWIDQQTI